MKLLMVLAIIACLAACESVADKPVEKLEKPLQVIVNHCKTCHSTQEMQRGPLLEGLELWYMEESTEAFRAGIRGTHPKDPQGLLMYAAVKDLPEDEVMQAIEWFAGQERPEIKAYIKGDVEKGAEIYKTRCFSCHEHTMGKFFSRSPDLYKLEDWYVLSQLRSFKKGWRGSSTEDNHGANMMVAVADMEDSQFKDVAAFLATFQQKPE
ncbi:MAG: cytochrome c [Lentisphaeraceae bacterium]|nr:cytochrome c [Lentisphaeraceae bacterium]